MKEIEVSIIVILVIKAILSLFFLFLRKDFEPKKTYIKSKPTSKAKASEQKTTKATFFCAQKLLRIKIVYFAFF